MRRFKNRIWTKDEYLMKYKSLNSSDTVTVYYADAVLFILCDGEIVSTYEEWNLSLIHI